MKTYRQPQEAASRAQTARIFEASTNSTVEKLENFPNYVNRVPLKRFLAHYEIFKRVLHVKGSVVECGVFKGFGLMAWAKISTILEPENLTRRIYGFDTFAGFPNVGSRDVSPEAQHHRGDLCADSYSELSELIREYDRDRFLGHIDKVHLIRGDATETIPRFISDHPHLLVSLLFLDLDLFDATRVALEQFVPRMPSGAVIAFDELDNPQWPGETLALCETLGIGSLKLERLSWDPYISFARVGDRRR